MTEVTEHTYNWARRMPFEPDTLKPWHHPRTLTCLLKPMTLVTQFNEARDDMQRTDSELGSIQFSPQSCLTLWDPMNRRTPGLPVHHQLPEFTQNHVHWVSDAIQPSHPLSPPPSPALNLSQIQGLFKWVSPSHQVAKSIGVSASTSVFPMNTQDWSPLA